MALATADELFERGDLTPFLTVLVRLHFLNFYNLLLILRQYPSATHLGSFKNWEKLMKRRDPGTKWILKKDQVGKGIELVAPFTNFHPEGTYSLSWHCLRQFDVSQTNIHHYEPPKSVYAPGPGHIRRLIRALRGTLTEDYGVTVLTAPFSGIGHSGSPGYIEGNTIHCNPVCLEPDLMMWLTESFLTLTYPEQVIGEKHKSLFLQTAQHCLYRIWALEDPHMLFLPSDPDLIRSVPTDLRPVFLDLLQRRVRHMEEAIYSKYQEELQEREAEAFKQAQSTLLQSE